jgi:Zn-dependent protease
MRRRCYDPARLSSYRDYENAPLLRFLQFVMRTFPIGTFFGVPVRMYWAGAILTPIVMLRTLTFGATSGSQLLQALLFSALLFLVVWSHEMSHIAAGWRRGLQAEVITLSPLGGVAHMNGPVTSPRDELFVTLAGPAVHLLWLAVFWPLELLLPVHVWGVGGFDPIADSVRYLVGLNLGLMLFNLLPLFPLDGGRALRALLSFRVHPNRATMWVTNVGIAGGGVLVLLALFYPSVLQSTIGMLLGLSCITSSLQERRMAQHVLVYGHALAVRRQPWEADPEAWKHGGQRSARERAPGRFARWRAARAARKAAARAAADAALDREVDAVLDRVHQVGMSGLDEREKAILKRAWGRRPG